MPYTYSFHTGQGGNGGPTTISGANDAEFKKNYVQWAMDNRANIGLPGFAGTLQTVGGAAPSLSDAELRAIYAGQTNKADPEQMKLLSGILGTAAPSTALNPDYTPAGIQAGLGVSPFEGGKTVSSSGQAVPMGYNQQQGAPSENPAYPQQLKAIASTPSPTGGTSTPAPRQYTVPTYTGGTGGTTGGGSAPAPYRPGTYSGPTSSTNPQYNGSNYQIQPFQAPQYEPVDLEQYFNQYSQYLMPSEQETQIKGDVNNLMASYRAGLTNIEGQPIAMQFVTGQSAAIDRQAEMEKANLLDALGLAQGNRLAMGDVAKAQYNFANEEALRRQHAGENAFNQWSTTQQLQMSNAKNEFDQWATEQGLGQQAANQAYQQWLGQQGLDMQASGQAYDQWLGGQQLSQNASQNQFNQWLQQQQLALQAQGMSADDAYRQAQLAQQNSQFQQGLQMTPYQQATLAQNQSQFDANLAQGNQVSPYQQATLNQNQSQFDAQHTLDQQKQVAALQQQLANMQKPIEVSSGASLMTPTGSVVGTAPKQYAPTGGTTPTPTSSSVATSNFDALFGTPSQTVQPPRTTRDTGAINWGAYQGNSIVDALSSAGLPSDYNSRAQMAARAGITNYTGTAEQNNQLLALFRRGALA